MSDNNGSSADLQSILSQLAVIAAAMAEMRAIQREMLLDAKEIRASLQQNLVWQAKTEGRLEEGAKTMADLQEQIDDRVEVSAVKWMLLGAALTSGGGVAVLMKLLGG